MTLDDLEKLADEAVEGTGLFEYRLAANPQTIKQMIALIRLQHEALNRADDIIYSEFCGTVASEELYTCKDALAAYEEFQNDN